MRSRPRSVSSRSSTLTYPRIGAGESARSAWNANPFATAAKRSSSTSNAGRRRHPRGSTAYPSRNISRGIASAGLTRTSQPAPMHHADRESGQSPCARAARRDGRPTSPDAGSAAASRRQVDDRSDQASAPSASASRRRRRPRARSGRDPRRPVVVLRKQRHDRVVPDPLEVGERPSRVMKYDGPIEKSSSPIAALSASSSSAARDPARGPSATPEHRSIGRLGRDSPRSRSGAAARCRPARSSGRQCSSSR